MPRPLLRLAQVFLVVAVFCLVNGSDFIAQGVAWGTMIFDYSAHDTVMNAVLKTFDGGHPCDLCKKVDEHQGSQQRSLAENNLRKLHLCAIEPEPFHLAGVAVQTFPAYVPKVVHVGSRPDLPPPRVA